MTESDVNANPMATLEPTIPSRPDEEETQLQELLLLGKDLERLLEVAKRDLEEIATQVDLGEKQVERLREFIYRVHQNRLAVLERHVKNYADRYSRIISESKLAILNSQP